MTSHTSLPLLYPPIPKNIGVAIVAPGGYAKDAAIVDSGIQYLSTLGCHVKNMVNVSHPYLRFSDTDEARLAQLYAAADDPDIQIVMALRGGYGLSRLLDRIDWQRLADSHKIFVGYSDVTALHLGLLAQTGYPSFAGPMLCSDCGCDVPSPMTMRSFWRTVTNQTQTITVSTEDNPNVMAAGTLWGGNLAMLTHLIGTPYFPKIDNGILFVEDVNEHPYRVERMLLQLLYSGVLDKQLALILGDFSAYRLTDYDNGYNFESMLDFIRSKVAIPVLTGLPFGHCHDRVTLPVGGYAHLTSDQHGFALTVSHYPVLTA